MKNKSPKSEKLGSDKSHYSKNVWFVWR